MPNTKIRFNVRYRKEGLAQAPKLLSKNLRGGLETVGKRLRTSSQKRMRRDTGEAQKSLVYRVYTNDTKFTLLVFSTLVQAFVDAYGLRRGVFPNFRVGSKLYKWVTRKLQGKESREVKTFEVPSRKRRRGRRNRQVRKIRRVTEVKTVNTRTRNRAKERSIKRATFLVARAIFKNGIKATHWNRRALEANKRMITRELSNAISRTVNELKK